MKGIIDFSFLPLFTVEILFWCLVFAEL